MMIVVGLLFVVFFFVDDYKMFFMYLFSGIVVLEIFRASTAVMM